MVIRDVTLVQLLAASGSDVLFQSVASGVRVHKDDGHGRPDVLFNILGYDACGATEVLVLEFYGLTCGLLCALWDTTSGFLDLILGGLRGLPLKNFAFHDSLVSFKLTPVEWSPQQHLLTSLEATNQALNLQERL